MPTPDLTTYPGIHGFGVAGLGGLFHPVCHDTQRCEMDAHGDSTGGNHCAFHVHDYHYLWISVGSPQVVILGPTPGIPGFHGLGWWSRCEVRGLDPRPITRSQDLTLRDQDARGCHSMVWTCDICVIPKGALPGIITHMLTPCVALLRTSQVLGWSCSGCPTSGSRGETPDP